MQFLYSKYLYTIKFYFEYIVLLFSTRKFKYNFKNNKNNLLLKKI